MISARIAAKRQSGARPTCDATFEVAGQASILQALVDFISVKSFWIRDLSRRLLSRGGAWASRYHSLLLIRASLRPELRRPGLEH